MDCEQIRKKVASCFDLLKEGKYNELFENCLQIPEQGRANKYLFPRIDWMIESEKEGYSSKENLPPHRRVNARIETKNNGCYASFLDKDGNEFVCGCDLLTPFPELLKSNGVISWTQLSYKDKEYLKTVVGPFYKFEDEVRVVLDEIGLRNLKKEVNGKVRSWLSTVESALPVKVEKLEKGSLKNSVIFPLFAIVCVFFLFSKPTNYYDVKNYGDHPQTAIGKDINQSQTNGSNNSIKQYSTQVVNNHISGDHNNINLGNQKTSESLFEKLWSLIKPFLPWFIK